MNGKDVTLVQSTLRKIIRTQLQSGDPPETRQTFDRLLVEGVPETEVWNLLTMAVGAEIFDALMNGRSYDAERLKTRLLHLPESLDDSETPGASPRRSASGRPSSGASSRPAAASPRRSRSASAGHKPPTATRKKPATGTRGKPLTAAGKKLRATTGGAPPASSHRSLMAREARDATPRASTRSSARGAVLQLKIALRDVRPPVWRRLLVTRDMTFWALHVAIQDAMGWTDSHLHQFEIRDSRTGGEIYIGVPDEDEEIPTRPSWTVPISRHLSREGAKIGYVYDFGDSWEHEIILEKRLSHDPRQSLPQCIGGRRRCPPEDCGGPSGYARMLRALTDPRDPERNAYLEWAGPSFDPAEFDSEEIVFSDPGIRLQERFDFDL